MRQRKLEALAAQCDEVRARLSEEPAAAFETILRLLHPTLPPVVVEIDLAALQPRCLVHYGSERSYPLPYTTRTAGVPFGALILESRRGVRLNEHIINQREGELELTIDARSDMPIGRTLHGVLRMESGFTQLAKEPLRFQFNVHYPFMIAVRRVLAGAGIGAGLLGLPRLVLSLLDGKKPTSLARLNFTEVVSHATHFEMALWPFFVALLVLLVCIYTALRIWLTALRGSER
jgi:hypothetical protein